MAGVRLADDEPLGFKRLERVAETDGRDLVGSGRDQVAALCEGNVLERASRVLGDGVAVGQHRVGTLALDRQVVGVEERVALLQLRPCLELDVIAAATG